MNQQIKEAVLKQASPKNKDFTWMPSIISEMDNLTPWGKIRLCMFDESVLVAALQTVYPKNHYKSLFNKCVELEKGPDFKWMYDMGRQYNCDITSPVTLDGSHFISKKTTNRPSTVGDRQWVYVKEKRHGISEITKLTESLTLQDTDAAITILGGKEQVFNLFRRMSWHWDHDLTSHEKKYEHRAYEAWKISEYGIKFQQFFGKHLPFWFDIL